MIYVYVLAFWYRFYIDQFQSSNRNSAKRSCENDIHNKDILRKTINVSYINKYVNKNRFVSLFKIFEN